MAETKESKMSFLANEIGLLDNDINLIKQNLPFSKKIVFYNGSGVLDELIVWNDLDKALEEFLLAFYENKKQDIFDEIKKELDQ